MNIKYFSMFSGIGGFELGIQYATDLIKELGFTANTKCVGFSEFDEYPASIYKNHFKEHINYGDATKIDPTTIPDFDILVGGFPCQAFSIAGKRKGFSDTRGTLFFDVARIIREKQPRYILLENVKGLLSHEKGSTYFTIISTLNKLGYDTQRYTLNSKNHGVPQSRERVFIIGYLRGRSSRKISFKNGSDTQNSLQVICIGNVHPSGSGMNGNIYLADSTICPTLTTNKGEGPKILSVKQLNQTNLKSNSNTQPYMQDRIYHTENSIAPALNSFNEHNIAVDLKQLVPGRQGYRIYDARFLACTQNTLGGGIGAKTGLYSVIKKELPQVKNELNYVVYDDYNSNIKNDGIVGTITPNTDQSALNNGQKLICLEKLATQKKNVTKPTLFVKNNETYLLDKGGNLYSVVVRKLTPVECERLQGFPDNWTKFGADGKLMSDSRRYKAVGNAVTVNVVRDIMYSIMLDMIQSEDESLEVEEVVNEY